MPNINNKVPIKLSSIANFWWFGFISAIFLIMILNIIAQHLNFEGYSKVFCNSLL